MVESGPYKIHLLLISNTVTKILIATRELGINNIYVHIKKKLVYFQIYLQLL